MHDSYVLPNNAYLGNLIDAVEIWVKHLKKLDSYDLLRAHEDATVNVASGLVRFVAKATACRKEISRRLCAFEEIQKLTK